MQDLAARSVTARRVRPAHAEAAMPRFNSHRYLAIHTVLHRFWLEDRAWFSRLTAREQWLLHDYFQPSKDWSDEDLVKYRARITELRPSLPSQAGKVIASLGQSRPPHLTRPTNRHGKQHTISMRAVVRPEIDHRKFAQALLRLAASQLREPEAPDEPPPRPPATSS